MTHQTEIVYYYPEGHATHSMSQHPERPERVEEIRKALKEVGWWDGFPVLLPDDMQPRVLTAVHTKHYLDRLKNACEAGEWYDQDTYLVPQSFQLAVNSAGGAIAVARKVWHRTALTGFALCRPPGHHATPGQAMGFCLLNNVALAAEDLIQNSGARKLAILDFDLHHGNGTQDIFWERGDVFYFSTHQWPLYPGTGRMEEIGKGDGLGTTANLPFAPGTGDEGFAAALHEIILPLLDRFLPEMLLVSVGFDSHWLDPLGYLQLSAQAYAKIIHELKSWALQNCQGRIALFLEGGYNLQATSACAQACVSQLLGKDWRDAIGVSPYNENTRWKNLIENAKSLWDL